MQCNISKLYWYLYRTKRPYNIKTETRYIILLSSLLFGKLFKILHFNSSLYLGLELYINRFRLFSYNKKQSSSIFVFHLTILFSSHVSSNQVLYDAALQYEASSDWVQAAEKWKACVNETLRQMEECRVQCEVASQRLPEDRGVDSVDGVFEKAAGK